MKVTTTFWSDEVFEFDNLLFINGKTEDVLFEANLNDRFQTIDFFNKISKFVKSKEFLKTFTGWDYDSAFCQFAVMKDGKVTPIKWFDLVISESVKISHDIAFETTLIHKNDLQIPFGKFPMWYKEGKKFPKYREFNLKSRAYKYISNQIRKNS
jgi:hypothetical protein